ncbi:SGNH/GDSL hydrolase family protein [Runella slithyformis]|uniref:Lipolytic protein G-D-S-L family n=1 Tax=Runella slithyformis (strain ATCC 29530 / DSM 19594 / LMG 11500 / NCIMB 11436 / LSU 4) TaxID=761193 RepID=A0A7U4E580_RUNSL|nr:SGNH/GDSL hydrolase family protein [Runella slithyformis]AEI48183.1 lipolytic protein G-D-S-L family [Runella slithyformis DSM 19594]
MKWIISILILTMACATESPMNNDQNPAPISGQYRYLSLGDSYTIGERVTPEERWSVILTDLLRKNNVNISNPEIIAQTGWTTAELQEGIKGRRPKGPFNLVSILIGVNNQYRRQSTERYREELQELLQQAIGFAGGNIERVFMLSTPDWGITPFAKGQDTAKIAAEIDAFNAVAKEECEKSGILFIDITPLSRTARNDATLIADDGLHFSGKMYRQWAELALPTVQNRVNK